EIYRTRLEQLVAQGTHFVRWGSVDQHALGMTIGCDNRRGGRDAGTHLIARGCSRIAFLGDASSHYPEFRDRYAGLSDVLREAGLAVDPGLHVDALSTEQSGYEAASRLIARGVKFDAIFAGSDLIAIGAMRALDEHGLSVPCDVALIGFDDIPAANLTRQPLTTVAQDYLRAGEVLVDALIGQIDRKPVTPTLLAPRLITRMTA
ncbi:MAG: LacI family transcriptional regulator, partial [Sphingobium sp.]